MLRTGFALSAVFVAIVACSSSASDNDSDSAPVVSAAAAAGLGALEHREGTRLKVQTLALSDGTHVPYAFYDTTLNEQCTPLLTPAGMRCVPTRAFQHAAFYASDAACTTLVTTSSVGCAKPTLAYGTVANGACGTTTYEFYEATGTAMPVGTQLYYATPTACVPIMKATTPVFAVSRVSPDRFSAVTQREPVSTARLRREVFVGADGSELVKYFPRDATLDRDCSAQGATPDAPSTCALMSYDGFPTGEFGDAACTHPAYSASCPSPQVLYESAGSVRRAGAALTKVYRGTAAACGAASTPVGPRFEATGLVISMAPVSALQLGTGRVQGSIAVNEMGEPLGLGGMADTTLHAGVSAQTASDGQSRFVPTSNALLLFSDAACTAALVRPLNDRTPADRIYALNPRADLCDGVSGPFNDVYTASGASTTPVEVYTLRDNTCAKSTVATGAKYYPARKMAPTELAPAVLSFDDVGPGDGGAPLSTTDAGASSSGSLPVDASAADADAAVVDGGASSSGTVDAGHSSSSSSGTADAGHASSSSSSSGSSSSSSSTSGGPGSSSSSGYGGGSGLGTSTEGTNPGAKPAEEKSGCAAAPASPARGLGSLMPALAVMLASRRRRRARGA